jgi:hypothetical protein
MRGVDDQILTKNRIPPAPASTPHIRAVDGNYRHRHSFRNHSIDREVVSHSHRIRIGSIAKHVVDLCLRESPVGSVRIAEQKAPDICRQRNIARNEFTDGKRDPDACWMDLLKVSARPPDPTIFTFCREGNQNEFVAGPLESCRFYFRWDWPPLRTPQGMHRRRRQRPRSGLR